jgi:hypothetical protein
MPVVNQRRMLLLALVCLAVSGGCRGLSDERVSRIRPGETERTEVTGLLGHPDVSCPDYVVYFGSRGRQLVVHYDDRGTVTALQYRSATDQPPGPADDAQHGQRGAETAR